MDASTTRPRAVSGVAARAKTGKPTSRLSSTSRQLPSTITPSMPFTRAASDRMPPQPAASSRSRCSMTITWPGPPASMAAVPRWRGTCSPGSARRRRSVITWPAMRGQDHIGRIPSTAPTSPSRSSASETAHVSSRASRATQVSAIVAVRVPNRARMPAAMGPAVSVKTAVGTYPYTRPLKDGTVSSPRLRLEHVEVVPVNRAFRPMVNDLAYDASEMALVTLLLARAVERPIVGIPVVMMQQSVYGVLLVRSDSPLRRPEDLQGSTIGVRSYTQTTGTWLRGMLHDQFGLDLDSLSWVTFE